MRRFAHNLSEHLGRASAFSWVMVPVVLIMQVPGSLLVSGVDYAGRMPEFLALRLLSLGALCVVLWLGRLLLLWAARTRPKPWLTVLMCTIAIVVGCITFDLLLIVSGFTEQSAILRRISTALPGVLPGLLVSALFVGYAREYAAKNQALAGAADQLLQTREQVIARIDRRQQALLEQIDREIAQEVLRIDHNAERAAERMRELVDGVLRPLSHRLANETLTEYPASMEPQSGRIPWAVVVPKVLATNPFHPIAQPLWLNVMTCSFYLMQYRVAGFGVALLSFAIGWLLLLIARAAWRFVPEAVGPLPRAVLFTVAFLPVPLVGAWCAEVLLHYSVFAPTMLIAWCVLSVSVAWSVALALGVQRELIRTNEALALTVDELKREVIAFNGAYRQFQKGVSFVLHGPVQDAISQSIRRLQSSDGAAIPQAVWNDVQHRITEALQLVYATPVSGLQIGDVTANIIELWDEVAEIRFDAAPADLALVELDPAASFAVSELFREACGNAIRHGSAQHVSATMEVARAERAVLLRVENDGAPLPESPLPGLGSQLLNEMCLSWSRTQTHGSVRLDARIPLSVGE